MGRHPRVSLMQDGSATLRIAYCVPRTPRKLAIPSKRPSCRLGIARLAPAADQAADLVQAARRVLVAALVDGLSKVHRKTEQEAQLLDAQIGAPQECAPLRACRSPRSKPQARRAPSPGCGRPTGTSASAGTSPPWAPATGRSGTCAPAPGPSARDASASASLVGRASRIRRRDEGATPPLDPQDVKGVKNRRCNGPGDPEADVEAPDVACPPRAERGAEVPRRRSYQEPPRRTRRLSAPSCAHALPSSGAPS